MSKFRWPWNGKSRGLHYIITLQWPASTGAGFATRQGIITPAPEATRQQLYLEVVEQYRLTLEALGYDVGKPNVLFFALEPNEIGGAA